MQEDFYSSQNEALEERKTVSVKAIVTGSLFVCVLACAVPYTDIYMGASELAGCHFGMGPMFVFIVLMGIVNPLLRLLSKRASFSGEELLLILTMCLVAVGIPSYGLTAQLLPGITAPFYYADETNLWADIFHRYLPPWLYISDPDALKSFYEGGSTVPWSLWFRPLVCWGVLIFFLYLFMFCLSVLIERQWIESERLAFPLVALPVEMAEAENKTTLFNPLFKNPLLWMGFAIPAVLHTINGLNAHFPSFPHINLRPRITVFEGTPFWPLNRYCFIYFSVIGFTYFLTTEVCFSLWFFWLMWRFQIVIANLFGAVNVFYWGGVGEAQFSGAFVAFVFAILYLSRSHFKSVFRATLSGSSPKHLYSTTGLALASIGVITWFTTAGISAWYALALLILFFLLCIGLARAVCESGMLFAKALDTVTPSNLLNPLIGTARIGAPSLAITSTMEWIFMFDLKTFLFPALVQGHRIRRSAGSRLSSYICSMALAVAIAVLLSIVVSLVVAYKAGGNNLSRWFYYSGPRYIYRNLAREIGNPQGTEVTWCISATVGAVFTLLLMFLRRMVFWWRVHPIGYILAQSWETERIWFSFLVGWLLKRSILKYGGGGAFSRMRAFFLGLIFGEYGMAGIWLIIDVLTGTMRHKVFP